MPITVTLPPPDSRVGPGIPIGGVSTLVGPEPAGTVWLVTVSTDPEGDDIIWQEAVPWFSPFYGRTSLTYPQGFSPGSHLPAASTAVFVTLEILNGSTGLIDDSGTAEGIYDPVGGLGVQAVQTVATGAGLTTEEHDAVIAAAGNTQVVLADMGAGGVDVVQSIAQLLPLLASPQVLRVHACRNITGQGSLARGAGEFRSDALGFEVHFVDIPPRFGALLGAVDEHFKRVVQFRTIRRSATSELYQDEVLDLTYDGQRHSWGVTVPETLEWYVAPGCVVQICFLVLLP